MGEFKFELELRTDRSPDEISWQIENGNRDILVSESGYNEQFTTFNYEYCLPVGCYDFVIDDSAGNGICCISDYYDDGLFDDGVFDYYGVEEIDDFDGYYKGSVYGWKEVFNGGEFGSQAIEHFSEGDLCA